MATATTSVGVKLAFRKVPFYIQIILAFSIGIVLGVYLQEDAKKLDVFTTWIIWLIKNAAIPLLFLAILDAMIQSEFSGRGFLKLLGISFINGSFAVAIALGISNYFQPGRNLPLESLRASAEHGLRRTFGSVGLSDAFFLFFRSPMVLAILSAIILGFLWRVWQSKSPHSLGLKKSSDLAHRFFKVWMQLMHWIIVLIPLAVLCSVAKIVGVHGFSMFHGLIWYIAICIGGMSLHVLVVYQSWIFFYARRSLREFWKVAREPMANGFGVNSSLATLPLTLTALKTFRVSDTAARMSTCIGTNFNNDGILLYEVVGALFLAQAYGIDLSLAQQFLAAAFAVVACVGVGGIPEAGVISLSIVLGAMGLPLEGITILLGVDWFIARCRSIVNVLGDMTCAVVLDKNEGLLRG